MVDTFHLKPDNAAGAGAPVFLGTYSEQLFIEAEATLIKSGAAAANPIYQSAIAAHMNMLGVAAGARDTYLAAKPALTDAGGLESNN